MTPPGNIIRLAASREKPKNFGAAIVERMGFEEDGRFTATLLFENGPPEGLTFATVWARHPVYLIEAARTTPRPSLFHRAWAYLFGGQG